MKHIIGSCKVYLKQLTAAQMQDLHNLSVLLCRLYNVAVEDISHYYAAKGYLPSDNYLLQQVSQTTAYKAVGSCYKTAATAALANYRLYMAARKYANRCSKDVATKKNLVKMRPPQAKSFHVPIRLIGEMRQGAILRLPATSLTSEMNLQLPDQYASKQVKSFVVHQLYGTGGWEAILSYYIQPKNCQPCSGTAMGIDLGVSNLATCATSDGKSFIVDGRYLKGLIYRHRNQHKRLVKQAKGKYSSELSKASRRCENRINDYISKSVHYIVKYCTDNKIASICLGWGLHFQQHTLNKNNYLMFHYFPFASFAHKLEHKCAQHGIDFCRVDESFSSLASFLDQDPMPAHMTRQQQQFSGKRRYRGLYISKQGVKVNADVNAALNILRKGNAISLVQVEAICSRGIAQPLRINPLKM